MNPCTSSNFILDLYKSSWENNFAMFSSNFSAFDVSVPRIIELDVFP